MLCFRAIGFSAAIALIGGAEMVLTAAGKPALAAQIEHLFTTKLGNDANTIGMVEFKRNLAIVCADNPDRPQDQPSEVENIPTSVLAAETPPPPAPAASVENKNKDKPPLIVHGPDRTITVQKVPPSGNTDGAQKGLVIPPQVVVPPARTPTNEPSNQAH